MSLILIVDEDKLSRWVIRQRLESAGYQVLEAGTCDEAKRLLEKESPQLVVLDHTMPKGHTFLSRLDYLEAKIPVILMSASDESAPKVFENSIFDFQQKPVQVVRFLNSVRHAIELRKLERKVADYEKDEDRY